MSGTNRGWIGVDLDGTLAKYEGWIGPEHIGEPIPAMVARVKEWLAQGYEVRIFTARVYCPIGDHLRHAEATTARDAIQEWTQKHLGKRLAVTNVKDFAMVELWDDRAYRVVPNTGERCCSA
jgi:FMN phosphatase YigB (HAD superfamily)